jgi:hypothetical protein
VDVDMLILGLISVLQILFLPGAIVQLRWKNNESAIFRLLSMTGLSLILNYLMAIVLVSVKLYYRPVLLTVLAGECLVLVMYGGRQLVIWLRQPAIQWLGQPFEQFLLMGKHLSFQLGAEWGSGRIARWLGILVVSAIITLAMFTFGLSLWSFYVNIGTIFSNSDALVSWNRWALDWFNNRFPQDTYAFYPQLLSANWSISYVMIGEPLQFFPKLIMPTFLVFIFLGLIDLAFKRKSLGFFLAIPFVGHIFFAAIGRFWGMGEGLADILVSYLSFLPFYCLAYAVDETEEEKSLKFITLGGVFASGASVAKQSALYVLAVYGIIAFLYLAKTYGFKNKLSRMCLVKMILSVILISAPFFIYRYIEIKKGIYPPISANNYKLYNNRVLGDTYLKRVKVALNDINSEILSPPLFANEPFFKTKPIIRLELIGLSLIGFLFVLSIPQLRVVVIFLGFGWLVIWSLFLSYDARNLSIAFPFLGVGIGVGLEAFLFRLKKFPLLLILLMSLAFLGIFSYRYPACRLREVQFKKQKQIGNAALNELLYKYKYQEGITGNILTNYQIMKYLPEFEPFYHLYHFESITNPANDLQHFHNASTKAQVGYLLVPEDSNPTIIGEVEKGIAQGNYELIFRVHQFLFVKKAGNGTLKNHDVIVDLMTGYHDTGVQIDGFGTPEGPYPQWSLPVVCWAKQPVASFEFDYNEVETNKNLILDWSCRLHVRPAGSVQVIMNGTPVKKVQLVGAQTWYEEKTVLPFKKGRNKVLLEFSKPQAEESNLDGYSMLYKKMSLHWEARPQK